MTEREIKIELKKAELIGVGKILDILLDNSFNSMGGEAVKILEKELIYYFGKKWAKDMYDLIGTNKLRYGEPVLTLKELNKL